MATTTCKVLGLFFTLFGVLGFIVYPGTMLGFYRLNAPHNLLHLLTGLAAGMASTRRDEARIASIILGATYVGLGVACLAGCAPLLSALNANVAGHILHAAMGIVFLCGLTADRRAAESAPWPSGPRPGSVRPGAGAARTRSDTSAARSAPSR
jgi:hypothetical protein